MTFHDTIWVVNGGAAPVIALAAIISVREVIADNKAISDDDLAAIGDAVVLSDEARTKEQQGMVWHHMDRWTGWGGSQAFAQLGNIGLQALLLTISMLSIAWQRNVFPIWFAVAAPVLGVVLLAVTPLFMLRVKQLAKKHLAGIQLRWAEADLAAVKAQAAQPGTAGTDSAE
jgi:hypothetical protein